MTPWSRAPKYFAQPQVVDGVRFASKKEAKRWGELQLLARVGAITNLRRQVVFPLHAPGPDGAPVFVASYIADAEYYEEPGGRIVEDVKGVKTPVYTLKRRWMAAEYGITIREV